MSTKLYETANKLFRGCDFVIQLGKNRQGTPIKLLQITDMQIIDATQRRSPERLRDDEIIAWHPDNFMAQCGNHIASLITQTKPDLIFITGDIVYGSFDDKGTTLEWFCSFMDSFEIPWAPTFGNHDNESAKGVDWQCAQFKNSKHCVFRQGSVSGNSNYSVGIAVGDELVRVLHMIDSNGCHDTNQVRVISKAGIYPDQLSLIKENTQAIQKAQGKPIPAFIAFHIPTDSFLAAEAAKGYITQDRSFYTLGVDIPALGNDFGFRQENYAPIKTECDFVSFLHTHNIDGVFVGHRHRISTCINYQNIRFVFGLKTGQYDYHLPGSIGGTLITLAEDDFTVRHVPSLVPYAPMPGKGAIFKDFFAE